MKAINKKYFLALLVFAFATKTFADVIDPIGNEFLAQIKFTRPNGSFDFDGFLKGPSTTTLIRQDVSYRVPAGTYCFGINTIFDLYLGNQPTSICNVKLVPKQFLELPILSYYGSLDVQINPQSFDIRFGKHLGITLQNKAQKNVSATGGKPIKGWLEPGDFKLQIWNSRQNQILNEKIFTVVAGDQQKVAIDTLSDLRLRLNLVPPQRSFPNVGTLCPQSVFLINRSGTRSPNPATAWINEPDPRDVYAAEGSQAIKDWDYFWSAVRPSYSIPYGITEFRKIYFNREVPFYPEGMKLEVSISNLIFPLPSQAGQYNLYVKRIDVNHVTVQREDGSKYIAFGSYQVFRKNNGNLEKVTLIENCSTQSPIDTFPTKTGVDVPPGEYKVVVNYKTEEGPQSQSYDLDLR